MSKPVFGLVARPEDAAYLASVMGRLHPEFVLVSSYTAPIEGLTERLLTAGGGAERIQEARERCEPLVRTLAPAWPDHMPELIERMEKPPENFHMWLLRNLLWQAAAGGFIYPINQDTLGTYDLTVHLTTARMFNQLTVGILPGDTRSMFESTQLTLTDAVVGEADARTLSAVLQSLNRGPAEPTDG